MVRKNILPLLAATLVTLLTSSHAGAWGYGRGHYGYTHVGSRGVYHVGGSYGYGGGYRGGYGVSRGYSYGGYRGGYGGYGGGHAGGMRYESPYSNGAYAQQAHSRMAYR
ncbi:MAG: hypothetical protein ACJ8FY_24180 [Gemmataceae bacterium]